MTAHSYHYHHRRILRFGRPGWNLRWCECRNYPNTLSLRLWNLSNCIPHLCHSYIRCYTLNSCGWGYGSTLTPLAPQRFPQIWESLRITEILDDVSVEMMMSYAHPQLFKVFKHLIYVWHRCGKQFERFYPLNNSVVGPFPHLHQLWFQRTFPNLGKPLWL